MPKNFFNSFRSHTFSKNDYKAFTLVEMLVVVGVLAILSTLIIIAIDPAELRRAARDSNRIKDLGIISAALEQYYSDRNAYPVTTSIDCLEEALENVGDSGCGSAAFDLGTTYMRVLPMGQSGADEYCYSSTGAGQNYIICAPTEANMDVDAGACTPTGVSGTIGITCVTNPF